MKSERAYTIRAHRIHTLDPDRAQVECLAVRGPLVVATGSEAEVRAAVGPVEAIDLRPACVVPGLTDSHIHLLEWAVRRGRPELGGAGTMTEALDRVGQVVEQQPADAWIEFTGWDPTWRNEASLQDLDRAARGRAVVLVAHDLHSAWLSSEAMRRLAITPDRVVPPGGEVERDAEGRPTGVLRERALDWWYEGRPRPGAEERVAALRQGQAALHRMGVTAVHSVEGPDAFGVVQALERSEELRLRVLHHLPQRHLEALVECGFRSGFGGDWLRIGGIKFFSDGALGSRTAWMLEPYADARGCGIQRLGHEELAAEVQRASAAGLSSTIHAIGDAAVRMSLDCLEATAGARLGLPHRIEHLQCVHPEDVARAARAGVVASMQPSHLLTDMPHIERAWGPERADRSFAFRKLAAAGTTFAFGSDAPVEPPDPREGFYAAVARRDRRGEPSEGWYPAERLTMAEALEAYTVGPARAAGDLDRRGRLAPGYLADFAAWDVDPVDADPETIRGARVLACVVGGELVFEA